MPQTISIDPVTRIEGHARITLHLNDDGRVENAQFHVTQMRGFEKFVEGRPFHEMPSLMARICGICPVSHLIASAKACDQLLAVQIPSTAVTLRRIMNLAQIAQSHALSFFYLSSPDLLLGMDAEPADRNIFGVMKANPQIARDGVLLRQTGQQIIEILGDKRIHPAYIVPGGVSEPLTEAKRDQILALLPPAIDTAQRTLGWFRDTLSRYETEIRTFANFPTLFMGLVSDEGTLEHYDGQLRLVDASARTVVGHLTVERYEEVIGEAVEPYSYLKSPYYKPLGYPNGIFRVGPLARLNIVARPGTPLADAAFADYLTLDRQSSFHFHFARLVEILYAFEKINLLLEAPDILSDHVRAYASPNNLVGYGVSEAPRGTLMHHYEIDRNGLVKRANLMIATGHNNMAMNRGILQVAQAYVDGNKLTEGMLNRVEAVIRAYDPCLSCSTHAAGQMPMQVQLLASDGEVVDELRR